MKVAAVQFAPEFLQVEANLRTAAKLVLDAARAGAELVVLPELCMTGYSFMSVEQAEPFAEVLGPDLKGSMKVMGELANKMGIAIAWGLIRKDPGSGHLYNSQVLLLPEHTWRFYDKVNLWGNDFIWAKEGDGSPPIVNFRGKKIGLLVCRDVRDKGPTIDDLYEKGDADIVAFSANWGNGGFPAVRWVSFAKENQTFLVVSNRYGKEVPNNFGEGGICIIEPCGRVRCEGLTWSAPCIVYAEVPLSMSGYREIGEGSTLDNFSEELVLVLLNFR